MTKETTTAGLFDSMGDNINDIVEMVNYRNAIKAASTKQTMLAAVRSGDTTDIDRRAAAGEIIRIY
jgi:hypothetical protein